MPPDAHKALRDILAERIDWHRQQEAQAHEATIRTAHRVMALALAEIATVAVRMNAAEEADRERRLAEYNQGKVG
jgi:hypothetical protein